MDRNQAPQEVRAQSVRRAGTWYPTVLATPAIGPDTATGGLGIPHYQGAPPGDKITAFFNLADTGAICRYGRSPKQRTHINTTFSTT